jgi:mRNA-degrading endonuclease toxin of MazEF toxin-antitoxin module
MPLSPGDICLVEYPFTDKPEAKKRPVFIAEPLEGTLLALTDGEGSPSGSHAVFIPITSRLIHGIYNVPVLDSHPDFKETGLKVSSTVLCWNLHTIHKAMIKHKLGKAPESLRTEVKDRLRALLRL